jgi:Flp pilus assembly protein TadG
MTMARVPIRTLARDEGGAAAAEMALVTPLLITLMMGSFELGNYFMSEHVVINAVRDGARFAARQNFSAYSCPGATVSDSNVATRILNVTRFGNIDGTGDPRLSSWTATTNNTPSVTVTVSCTDITGGAYSGIYTIQDQTSIPEVKVSATVNYHSLFNMIGLTSALLKLDAESQATVVGQ